MTTKHQLARTPSLVVCQLRVPYERSVTTNTACNRIRVTRLTAYTSIAVIRKMKTVRTTVNPSYRPLTGRVRDNYTKSVYRWAECAGRYRVTVD